MYEYMTVIEGNLILHNVSIRAAEPHEFLLHIDGPEPEFVKSSRSTSCLCLIRTFLHDNSMVMKIHVVLLNRMRMNTVD